MKVLRRAKIPEVKTKENANQRQKRSCRGRCTGHWTNVLQRTSSARSQGEFVDLYSHRLIWNVTYARWSVQPGVSMSIRTLGWLSNSCIYVSVTISRVYVCVMWLMRINDYQKRHFGTEQMICSLHHAGSVVTFSCLRPHMILGGIQDFSGPASIMQKFNRPIKTYPNACGMKGYGLGGWVALLHSGQFVPVSVLEKVSLIFCWGPFPYWDLVVSDSPPTHSMICWVTTVDKEAIWNYKSLGSA